MVIVPVLWRRWLQKMKLVLSLSYSIPATISKYLTLGHLEITEMSSSQFWRLEVQDQGTSRVGVW
jgi:hypothetical protein